MCRTSNKSFLIQNVNLLQEESDFIRINPQSPRNGSK